MPTIARKGQRLPPALDSSRAGRGVPRLPPRARRGRFGYADDDEVEKQVRMYADHSGEDADELLLQELAQRAGLSPDEYLAKQEKDNPDPLAKMPAAEKKPAKKPSILGSGIVPGPDGGKTALDVAKELPRPTLTPRGHGDLGGFLLGLVGYSLAMAYIKYGPKGPTSWFTAKFFNKPLVGPLATGTSATTLTPTTGDEVYQA